MIATHNRCAELRSTLQRNIRGEHNERNPIIVVDNGSEDDTNRMVHDDFPDVTFVGLSKNIGAVARNIGVRLARTPYIAFSDDDSWWSEGTLDHAEHVLDTYPHLALIAARTLVGPEQRLDPVVNLMANSPLTSSVALPGPSILGFTACSAVLRKQAFVEVGGFSRVLGFVGEEKLLSYDLAAAGWQLAYLDSVVAHHHPSRERFNASHRQSIELRNDALIAWMRRPLRTATERTRSLAGHCWTDPTARRALTGVLRRLPRALARRHRLPQPVENQITTLEQY